MITSELLGHADSASAAHMAAGSIWTVLSMIAFSLFLFVFAWSLMRPTRHSPPTPADIAIERYAHGMIDADDLERILSDIEPSDIETRPR
ncbi:MAG: hypothetical protein ABJH68_12360 [Ilumatobacter sp.]|uniref:hypothetical protein n=1 Tax=Ilumatobacter sp. TaxID=1967498 RepID=UPI0032985B41